MPLAQLTNIEKVLGDRLMFDRLNFNIERGERVGLIGDNGAGKTTLFKTLLGEITPDSGDVSVARSTKVGYLAQDAAFDPANSVIDEAETAFAELHTLAHDLREIEHKMAELDGEGLDKALKRYEDLQHQFEDLGGYAFAHRLEATLEGVGLPREMWETNVEKLSGGQRSRLALAKLLIMEPDFLLLDEPTNHLDLEAIEWLENYLIEFTGAVLVISHDRYLLDKIATRIVWLTQRRLNSYPGNYSAFVVQKELHELSQARAFEQQQADIEKQKEFIRRFSAGQRAREAQGRAKKLNRLLKSDAMVGSVQASKHIHVNITTDQRAGDQVLKVRELSKSFPGRSLWQSIGFDIKRGERIGVIGPNGAGKTTLLKVLMGEADADAGDLRWGANLNIGYYDQRLDEFDPQNTILEEVGEGRGMPEKVLRDKLGTLLFTGEDVHKPMALLSGGERARVALMQLMLDGPNVLLLDEPTNHLDINSCEALEQTLRGFEGTLIVVSHDRYFLEKTVGRLLVIEPPDLIDFEGTFHEWHDKQATRTRSPADPSANRVRPQTSKPQPGGQAAAKQQPVRQQNGKPPAAGKRSGGGPGGGTGGGPSPSKADNPYLRPFGKLSTQELEREITEAETDVATSQEKLAGLGKSRDPNRAKRLKDEAEQAGKKLRDLEAEYYTRGK